MINQRFDPEAESALPESPDKCVMVWPRRGHYLLFTGELGHGALDSANVDVRITILVNWWRRWPKVRCKAMPKLSSRVLLCDQKTVHSHSCTALQVNERLQKF